MWSFYENCQSTATLKKKINKYIQDHLVVGVTAKKILECLLSERALTFGKAIEIAMPMEFARKYSKLILVTKRASHRI